MKLVVDVEGYCGRRALIGRQYEPEPGLAADIGSSKLQQGMRPTGNAGMTR